MDKLLSGRRILVVEDEMLMLTLLEDILADAGCESVTGAATIDQAVALIDGQVFDAATLDIKLNGNDSYPVAEALAARAIRRGGIGRLTRPMELTIRRSGSKNSARTAKFLRRSTIPKRSHTMTEKTASVHWEGQGKKGEGQVSTETGALKNYPYGFLSRFQDDRRGTNPEEILGAAHAACFTMAFSFACDKAGLATTNVDTKASVRLSKLGEGFVIDRRRPAAGRNPVREQALDNGQRADNGQGIAV
jgi:OsmC subfamily peroxiredoxin